MEWKQRWKKGEKHIFKGLEVRKQREKKRCEEVSGRRRKKMKKTIGGEGLKVEKKRIDKV